MPLADGKGDFSPVGCVLTQRSISGCISAVSLVCRFKGLYVYLWTLHMRLALQDGLARPVPVPSDHTCCEVGQIRAPAS